MLSAADACRIEEEIADGAHRRWQFPPAKILVVDDGAENRELVVLVLTENGLAVEEAENGQVAVDRCAHTRYDAILMDMSMPVMDGFTATRTLRERGLATPIFALTAHAMKGFEQEILAAGCTGYVTKPIDLDVLLGALADKLGGRRVVGEAVTAAAAPAPADPPPAPPRAVPSPVAAQAAGDESTPVVSTYANQDRMWPILRKFAVRLESQVAAMEAAHRGGDMKELAALAHWLKGAGGTVGYHAFTVPARTLEDSAKAGDAAGSAAVLRELRHMAARLVVPAEQAAA